VHRMSMSFPAVLIEDAKALAVIRRKLPTDILRQAAIVGMMQLRGEQDRLEPKTEETPNDK